MSIAHGARFASAPGSGYAALPYDAPAYLGERLALLAAAAAIMARRHPRDAYALSIARASSTLAQCIAASGSATRGHTPGETRHAPPDVAGATPHAGVATPPDEAPPDAPRHAAPTRGGAPARDTYPTLTPEPAHLADTPPGSSRGRGRGGSSRRGSAHASGKDSAV